MQTQTNVGHGYGSTLLNQLHQLDS